MEDFEDSDVEVYYPDDFDKFDPIDDFGLCPEDEVLMWEQQAMWYKVYADGTELDIVHAVSSQEAIEIVKRRLIDTCFDGIVWTTKHY